MKRNYRNVLALTQGIRRCQEQHKTDLLLLKVVFSAEAQPSMKSWPVWMYQAPQWVFFFLSLRVVEHIPDDYRNSATTFMIVIITRPLHPCSRSSWENPTVCCNLRGENSCFPWYINMRHQKSTFTLLSHFTVRFSSVRAYGESKDDRKKRAACPQLHSCIVLMLEVSRFVVWRVIHNMVRLLSTLKRYIILILRSGRGELLGRCNLFVFSL